MLDKAHIETAANNAAYVAYTVLGLDCDYSLKLIDDPSTPVDGLLGTKENIILINLAKLEPVSVDAFVDTATLQTDEEKHLDENYRHLLQICIVVFHEMRHLFQKRAMEIYSLNHYLGGGMFKPLVSKKICEQWMSAMAADKVADDEIGEIDILEEDANDFAYYLSNRYPIELPIQNTNARIGGFKRKYDKVPIPETKWN